MLRLRPFAVVSIGCLLALCASPASADVKPPIVVRGDGNAIVTQVNLPATPPDSGQSVDGRERPPTGQGFRATPVVVRGDNVADPLSAQQSALCVARRATGDACVTLQPPLGQPAATAAPGAGAPAPVVPVVTPGELAVQARNTLRLPLPAVRLSPRQGPGRFQLVNFPTWWWLTNFAPLSQTTTAGAVFATVTAKPVSSVFDGGQGDPAHVCTGPGVAWQPALPGDYYAACTYTFLHAADSVTATVTVTWRVSWVGSGGTSGVLAPMQVSTALPLTVYERQAVNVPVGSSLPSGQR